MRQEYIAGNWKMHKTRDEARSAARALAESLAGVSRKIMIAPPFTALDAVAGEIAGSKILLGAQNVSSEREGAHTGEVSAAMLLDVGVAVAIVGHSERRHVYGETEDLIARRIRMALEHGLEVVVCVGETLDEREGNRAQAVVSQQLDSALAGVAAHELSPVTIAYEPVWAIGTGKTASPQDAEEMHRHLRQVLAERFGAGAAREVALQYGGSVRPENAASLMGMENIDGLLVGGASLVPESFASIVRYDEETGG